MERRRRRGNSIIIKNAEADPSACNVGGMGSYAEYVLMRYKGATV